MASGRMSTRASAEGDVVEGDVRREDPAEKPGGVGGRTAAGERRVEGELAPWHELAVFLGLVQGLDVGP